MESQDKFYTESQEELLDEIKVWLQRVASSMREEGHSDVASVFDEAANQVQNGLEGTVRFPVPLVDEFERLEIIKASHESLSFGEF